MERLRFNHKILEHFPASHLSTMLTGFHVMAQIAADRDARGRLSLRRRTHKSKEETKARTAGKLPLAATASANI